MQKSSATIQSLSLKIEQLETQLTGLEEALKILLPLAITIPACTTNSAQTLIALNQALAKATQTKPRSNEFHLLAQAMALMLSSEALNQHPQDREVAAIYQGLRTQKT